MSWISDGFVLTIIHPRRTKEKTEKYK